MKEINPLETSNHRKRRLARIHKEQITQLRIACGMSGMNVNDASCEMILMIQAGIDSYGGDFDLYTASRIADHIHSKYSPKKRKK